MLTQTSLKKYTSKKKGIGKLNLLKLNIFSALQNKFSSKREDKTWTERKYLQKTCLKKNCYPNIPITPKSQQ